MGLDSLRSKETRAIHVWRDTVSQLSIDEELPYNDRTTVEQDDSDDDLDTILSHHSLRVNIVPFYIYKMCMVYLTCRILFLFEFMFIKNEYFFFFLAGKSFGTTEICTTAIPKRFSHDEIYIE